MRKFLTIVLLFYFNQVFLQTTQNFTASGSFTVPAGVTSIFVEAWGAGGAGGSATGSASFRAMGGGGGGGSFSSGTIMVNPNDIISYTVAPATGLNNSNSTALDGGNSSFGGVTALGGKGGQSVVASSGHIGGAGGAGGIGNFSGGKGGSRVGYDGTPCSSACSNPNGAAGGGGAGNMASGNDASDLFNNNIGGSGGSGNPGGSGTPGKGADGRTSHGGGGAGGLNIGGGGAGGWATTSISLRAGGEGARGHIRITYTVLPIKISSFEISKLKDSKTLLNLTTASETNNDYFTIERSGDGVAYEAIGRIKGAGNSSREISYEFTDEAPLRGVNYYRIKQTDFDGKYSYSEVRTVRFTDGASVTVSPRTTAGRIDITTDMEDYTVEVYTASGAQVQKHAAMNADQTIDIQDLKAGIYFLRVSSGAHSETVRVVKQ